MLSCPGEEILILLGSDAFSNATYAAIEEHVERCPRCTAALESPFSPELPSERGLRWRRTIAANPRLRNPVQARRRRHGRGLPGERNRTGSSGRPQDPSRRLRPGGWPLPAPPLAP